MCEEKQDDRFIVDDPEKADWALRQIQKAKRQQAENAKCVAKLNEEPQQLIDANNEWLESENSKLDESIEYFESLLHEFMNTNLQDDPKFKFSSPYGRLSTRKSKKWTFDDDELIERYKHTDAVKETFKLNKTVLKKHLKVVNGKAIDIDTGEVVDGVSIEEERKITIKTED